MVRQIDPEVLLQMTGQTEVRDAAESRRRLQDAETALRAARRELARNRLHAAYQRLLLLWARLVRFQRRLPLLCERSGLGREVLALFGATAAIFLVAPVLVLLRPGPVMIFASIIAVFLGAGALLLGAFTPRAGEDGSAAVADRLRLLQLARESVSRSHQEFEDERRRHDEAHRLHHAIVQAETSALNRLLHADWDALTGDEFERYLIEVFRNLGYHVQHTGHSGDQGVDLVLEHNGVRIAVQAKCYQGAVNNAAVQQVYAGMVHHGCHRCAVITNSYFTEGGRQLAASVGCGLVDRDLLPGVIRGRVCLEDLSRIALSGPVSMDAGEAG